MLLLEMCWLFPSIRPTPAFGRGFPSNLSPSLWSHLGGPSLPALPAQLSGSGRKLDSLFDLASGDFGDHDGA
jgi:hypothetical protein